MNKHFEDAQYYLKRALETAADGVREELEPVETRFREMTGREKAPETSRLDSVQTELRDIEGRAEGEARKAIGKAREQISAYRSAE